MTPRANTGFLITVVVVVITMAVAFLASGGQHRDLVPTEGLPPSDGPGQAVAADIEQATMVGSRSPVPGGAAAGADRSMIVVVLDARSLAPVSDAEVVMTEGAILVPRASLNVVGRTDSQGIVTLQAGIHDGLLGIRKAGYAPQHLRPAIGGGAATRTTVRLEPAAELIVDCRFVDGTPARGVVVMASRSWEPSGAAAVLDHEPLDAVLAPHAAVSDEAGTVIFRSLQKSKYQLTVRTIGLCSTAAGRPGSIVDAPGRVALEIASIHVARVRFPIEERGLWSISRNARGVDNRGFISRAALAGMPSIRDDIWSARCASGDHEGPMHEKVQVVSRDGRVWRGTVDYRPLLESSAIDVLGGSTPSVKTHVVQIDVIDANGRRVEVPLYVRLVKSSQSVLDDSFSGVSTKVDAGLEHRLPEGRFEASISRLERHWFDKMEFDVPVPGGRIVMQADVALARLRIAARPPKGLELERWSFTAHIRGYKAVSENVSEGAREHVVWLPPGEGVLKVRAPDYKEHDRAIQLDYATGNQAVEVDLILP